MYIKSYKELIVWQKSILLIKEVFTITKKFPPSELYGLTAQIKRAVVSIASNIAEGHGRGTTKYFLHFLSIAYGSTLEVETQLVIAKELGFLTDKDCLCAEELLTEVSKMLNAMLHKMKGGFLDASR